MLLAKQRTCFDSSATKNKQQRGPLKILFLEIKIKMVKELTSLCIVNANVKRNFIKSRSELTV